MAALIGRWALFGRSRSSAAVYLQIKRIKNPVGGNGSKCYQSNFSRMIDLGGSPSASTSTNKAGIPNTSKNSKIQGVAFDFELLCKNIQDEAETVTVDPSTPSGVSSSGTQQPGDVRPNVDKVKEVASLLNVDLNKPDQNKKPVNRQEEDDLSLIGEESNPSKIQRPSKITSSASSSGQDVRAKYADKLHKKGLDGGLAAVELARSQIEDTLKRGDAAGHVAARKIAAGQSSKVGTKWMSLTGTGKLLNTLTHRSMKIALIPRPKKAIRHNDHGLNDDRTPMELMEDLRNQLREVEFNVLVEQSTEDSSEAVKSMVKKALDGLRLDPKVVLFVSDQDASLRIAKDLGMITCRIRPPNARRGNVSAHYTVKGILNVHDVVNEMNGISFNAVLNA